MNGERVLGNGTLHDGWRLIRVSRVGATAAPGQWVWLDTPARRWPLPVHRDHPDQGWVAGLMPPEWGAEALRPELAIRVSAPEGAALPERSDAPAVLLGVGAGIGAVLAVAERLQPPPLLVILDAASGLPSRVCPSRFMVSTLPMDAIAGLASLERRGIASRIAAPDGRPGCFEGSGVALLRHYLAELPAAQRQGLTLVASTPWDALARWRHALESSLGSVALSILPAPPRRAR